MPEGPDFHELDDRAHSQTALNGRDLAGEVEGYNLVLDDESNDRAAA
jgi:hypothetical protein